MRIDVAYDDSLLFVVRFKWNSKTTDGVSGWYTGLVDEEVYDYYC